MQKLIYIMLFVLVASAFSVAAGGLEIDKVEITRDGVRLLSTSSSSGSFDVDPGDDLRVKIWLENTFDDDTDNDIRDVRVVGVIEDIDDGDDEDDSETVDVRAGSKKTVTLRFSVPNYASSYESYDIEITACGRDIQDEEHCDSADYDIDVDREEHELVFETLQVSDAYCDGEVDLRLEIQNLGEDEEWDVELSVYQTELGTLFKDEFDIASIDDDHDDNFYSVNKRLDVDGLPAGRHTLTVKVLYDDRMEELERRIEFQVDSCGRALDAVSVKDVRREDAPSVERYSNPNRDTRWLFGEDEPVVVQMPPADVYIPSPPGIPGQKEDSFGIWVLALANIALLIFVVLLLKNLYY